MVQLNKIQLKRNGELQDPAEGRARAGETDTEGAHRRVRGARDEQIRGSDFVPEEPSLPSSAR